MQGRRSNVEIIADILRMGQTKKTDIMYGCDLSYYQLQRYLHFLLGRGLLEMDDADNPRKAYRPTALGEQLLVQIDRLRTLMGLHDRDEELDEFKAEAATPRSAG